MSKSKTLTQQNSNHKYKKHNHEIQTKQRKTSKTRVTQEHVKNSEKKTNVIKDGSGVSINLPTRAEEFLKRVASVLPTEDERQKLFKILRQYHEDRKIKPMVQSLLGLLNDEKKQELIKDVRLMISPEHVAVFDKYSDASRNGERFIRVKRNGSGTFGFSFRGGKEYNIGLYVTNIIKGSPADVSGLRLADELCKINGLPLYESIHDEVVALLKRNHVITLLVKNEGKVPCKVDNQIVWEGVDADGNENEENRASDTEKEEMHSKKDRLLAFNIGKTGLGCSIRTGIKGHKGVFVTDISKNSLAEKHDLRIGDQLLDVCGKSFTEISHDDAIKTFRTKTELTMVVRYNEEVAALMAQRKAEMQKGKGSKSILRKSSTKGSIKKRASFNSHVEVTEIQVPTKEELPEESDEDDVIIPSLSNYEYPKSLIGDREVHYVFVPKTGKLGIELEESDGVIMVKSLRADGAIAQHGFIEEGDLLLNVEGDEMKGRSVREAKDSMKNAMKRWSKYIELIIACSPGRTPAEFPSKKSTSEVIRDSIKLADDFQETITSPDTTKAERKKDGDDSQHENEGSNHAEDNEMEILSKENIIEDREDDESNNILTDKEKTQSNESESELESPVLSRNRHSIIKKKTKSSDDKQETEKLSTEILTAARKTDDSNTPDIINDTEINEISQVKENSDKEIKREKNENNVSLNDITTNDVKIETDDTSNSRRQNPDIDESELAVSISKTVDTFERRLSENVNSVPLTKTEPPKRKQAFSNSKGKFGDLLRKFSASNLQNKNTPDYVDGSKKKKFSLDRFTDIIKSKRSKELRAESMENISERSSLTDTTAVIDENSSLSPPPSSKSSDLKLNERFTIFEETSVDIEGFLLDRRKSGEFETVLMSRNTLEEETVTPIKHKVDDNLTSAAKNVNESSRNSPSSAQSTSKRADDLQAKPSKIHDTQAKSNKAYGKQNKADKPRVTQSSAIEEAVDVQTNSDKKKLSELSKMFKKITSNSQSSSSKAAKKSLKKRHSTGNLLDNSDTVRNALSNLSASYNDVSVTQENVYEQLEAEVVTENISPEVSEVSTHSPISSDEADKINILENSISQFSEEGDVKELDRNSEISASIVNKRPRTASLDSSYNPETGSLEPAVEADDFLYSAENVFLSKPSQSKTPLFASYNNLFGSKNNREKLPTGRRFSLDTIEESPVKSVIQKSSSLKSLIPKNESPNSITSSTNMNSPSVSRDIFYNPNTAKDNDDTLTEDHDELDNAKQRRNKKLSASSEELSSSSSVKDSISKFDSQAKIGISVTTSPKRDILSPRSRQQELVRSQSLVGLETQIHFAKILAPAAAKKRQSMIEDLNKSPSAPIPPRRESSLASSKILATSEPSLLSIPSESKKYDSNNNIVKRSFSEEILKENLSKDSNRNADGTKKNSFEFTNGNPRESPVIENKQESLLSLEEAKRAGLVVNSPFLLRRDQFETKSNQEKSFVRPRMNRYGPVHDLVYSRYGGGGNKKQESSGETKKEDTAPISDLSEYSEESIRPSFVRQNNLIKKKFSTQISASSSSRPLSHEEVLNINEAALNDADEKALREDIPMHSENEIVIHKIETASHKPVTDTSTKKTIKSILASGKKSSPKRVQFSDVVSVGHVTSEHDDYSSPKITTFTEPMSPEIESDEMNLSSPENLSISSFDEYSSPSKEKRSFLKKARHKMLPGKTHLKIDMQSLDENIIFAPMQKNPAFDGLVTKNSFKLHGAMDKVSAENAITKRQSPLMLNPDDTSPTFNKRDVEREDRIRRRQSGFPSNMNIKDIYPSY